MRTISVNEINFISGGEIICTVGTSGANCTGSATELGDVIFGAYDYARLKVTDAFEAIASWF